MRILLVNLHSSYNAGDDALTSLALEQLHREFRQSSFTLAMNDPRSFSGKELVVDSFTNWIKPIGTTSPGWKWQLVPALVLQSLLA